MRKRCLLLCELQRIQSSSSNMQTPSVKFMPLEEGEIRQPVGFALNLDLTCSSLLFMFFLC